MKVADILAALELPSSAMVNQRVAKQMLAEHGAPTAADKRNILTGIDEIQWLAALKPSNIGVTAFRDETRTYLELAVLSLNLRTGANTSRLTQLVHRAIPYPVLLIVNTQDQLALSLAHIRQAQNEALKTVLDGESILASLPGGGVNQSFLQAMALQRQPRIDLFALYQGWFDKVMALEVAQLTGHFSPSDGREQAIARHLALQQYRDLDSRITSLQATAKKEKQLARQVAINLELITLNAQRNQLSSKL